MVLSGGGTGGHIYPGLAVAEALRQADSGVELLYIGARGRMDGRIVPEAGVPFESVSAAPLRTGSPLSALRNIATLLLGTAQAWRSLGRFRPDVVFVTGGYASVPVGLAARLRRRPLLVYLPDISAGWAVRLLSRLATRIATTAVSDLPAKKTEAVGYPVRAAFWSADRATARRGFGLPENEAVLLVTGASQGAHSLNVAVAQQLDALLDACHVVHLTGRDDEREMLARRVALPEATRDRYHVFGYFDEMADAMAAADLAVMRAGASTLGELPAAGLPAVLVPGVYEGGHTQLPNARYLEEQGAAVVLEDDQLVRLTDVVRDLFAADARRNWMADAIRRLARPHAAQRLASMLQEMAA